jgi:hypothetical protein
LVDAVIQLDAAQDHASRERLSGQPDAGVLGPAVRLLARDVRSRLNPEPTAEVRSFLAVLYILAGNEGRGCPRLPDGKYRLHGAEYRVAGGSVDSSMGPVPRATRRGT